MLYELRVYTTLPGRLSALLDRFQNHTLAIWDKHGIRQVGFWTTVVGDSSATLTYMLVWDSMGDRETKWNAFISDPEWLKVKTESEKSGQINVAVVNSFLQPTAFSALK